jgi:hypothetical protein
MRYKIYLKPGVNPLSCVMGKELGKRGLVVHSNTRSNNQDVYTVELTDHVNTPLYIQEAVRGIRVIDHIEGLSFRHPLNRTH